VNVGYGTWQRGRNIEGQACWVDGITWTNCIGLHAAANVVYGVKGFNRFTARVDLDDRVLNSSKPGATAQDKQVCDTASHIFKTGTFGLAVRLDGTQVYSSGLRTLNDAGLVVDVALTNTNELELVVTDGDGAITCDVVDVVNGVLYAGGATATPTAIPLLTSTPTLTPAPVAGAVSFWDLKPLCANDPDICYGLMQTWASDVVTTTGEDAAWVSTRLLPVGAQRIDLAYSVSGCAFGYVTVAQHTLAHGPQILSINAVADSGPRFHSLYLTDAYGVQLRVEPGGCVATWTMAKVLV
jgi:hypothetical protein